MTPPRFQFGVRTIFVVVTVAAVLLAVGATATRYITRDYYVIDRFDCGHQRTITLYAHNFCDLGDIPLYEIRQGDDLVVQKSATTLWFSCGKPIESSDLRLIVKEEGNLVAVMQISTKEFALIHDFASSKSWPRDDSPQLGSELKSRMAK